MVLCDHYDIAACLTWAEHVGDEQSRMSLSIYGKVLPDLPAYCHKTNLHYFLLTNYSMVRVLQLHDSRYHEYCSCKSNCLISNRVYWQSYFPSCSSGF